jgi:pimeloyl-ACP methyl ester carboxylesterase
VGKIDRPTLEGSIAVRDGRRLSFAEFGARDGEPMVWMHGTPGGRRQIPMEAREYAASAGVRIIGLDRPGIGSSTRHLYRDVLDFADDLSIFLDTLGIEQTRVIGLSGGGAYTLAAGAAMPDRIRGLGVLGGVAPTVGPDAVGGGAMSLALALAPLLAVGRVPLSLALGQGIRVLRPLAGAAISTYAVVQPEGDRRLLSRPEFRAMFLDDLLNGSRFQMSAPIHDLVLMTRDWGFELADVQVPVRWWHGDADHIVPHAHGTHVVSRLPEARFATIPGESHLGGLSLAQQVIEAMLELDGIGSLRTRTTPNAGNRATHQSQ